MKKIGYTIIVSLLIWSCGGGGGNDTPPPPPPVQNTAPTIPSLVYPTDNLLCIDNTQTFQWNASTDAEGNAITYNIQVATDLNFTQIIHDLNESTTSRTISMEKGTAYYWRVKATDSKSASSNYSTIFNLYTEGEGISNYVPFSPELVSPQLNATETGGSTVTLEWNASDVDNDPLTFDVYVDTVNPPTNLQATDISPATLDFVTSASAEYFWKVVVKDGKGGQTTGQIWTFKTD